MDVVNVPRHASGRTRTTSEVHVTKLLLTVQEAAATLSLGRSTVYTLLETGELERVKVGRAARVTATSVEAYVSRLRDGLVATPDAESAAR
jgi:excisionase family DNA binding protein